MNRFLAFIVALLLGIDTCPAPVDFDGTDDYVSLGDVATPSALTVSAWVNVDSYTSTAASGIVSHYVSSGNQRSWACYIASTGYIWCTLSSDGTYQSANDISGTTILVGTGTWRHCVMTWDGTGASGGTKLFVDGQLAGTSTASPSSLFNASVNVTIGVYAVPGDAIRHHDGQIQDVRIYNRALSAAEIETVYLSRIGEGNPISDGLVLHLPLNDNSGNLASATFVDRSGNGNSGTGSDAGGSGGQCSRETFLTSP